MERLAMETKNITNENIQKILELFPNVATEGVNDNGEIVRAIDFEKLKQELSDVVIDGEESYDFTWVGKKEAMLEANRPIRKTLRPDRESSVDWENTENIYIEGDNLEALKLLQESYFGKVNIIYIDPPYNTGNDFVYRDNFTQDKDSYHEELGINDEEGNRLFQNTESNGRFHSDWCSMIYSRLKLARNLLSNDGVIFISIDDNEVIGLRKICDEIFGEDNFIAVFPRLTTKSGKTPTTYMISHDYVICYTKQQKDIFIGKLYADDSYKYEDAHVEKRGKYNLKQPLDCNSISYSKSLDYPIEYNGKIFYPGGSYEKYIERKEGKFLPKDYAWRWSKELFEFGLKNDWIVFSNNNRIYTKGYLNAFIEKNNNGEYFIEYREKTRKMSTIDFIDNLYSNDIAKKQLAGYQIEAKFDYPKPIELLTTLFSSYYKKDAVIMDFFSGSATTTDSIMTLNRDDDGNRKFILVQLPEIVAGNNKYKNICEIGKERIRRAGKKIKEENPDKKIDTGFRVFKVDDTNMKNVYYTPSEMKQSQLGIFESNIKEDRTDEDLLYGVLLDWGVELSLPHRVEVIDGKRVHIVAEDVLVACFEDDIPESVIHKIAEKKPMRVVFRDSSFNRDANKINVEEIFKLKTPDTTVKVI